MKHPKNRTNSVAATSPMMRDCNHVGTASRLAVGTTAAQFCATSSVFFGGGVFWGGVLFGSLTLGTVMVGVNDAIAQEISDQQVEEYAKDANTEINVKNADIAAIIRIFSKKTKRNYILDENVRGKVTMYLPGKVTPDEAIRILDSVLSLKGFSTVPIGDNLWKIVPSKQAKQSTIPTITDETSSDGLSAAMVTRLLNLKYVSADDVKNLISQLISPDGLVNAYTGTNSLIIIDSEDNIGRLESLITSLDVPFSDREMTIIPILHADATDIAAKLAEILGEGSAKGKEDTSALDLIRARIRESAGEAMRSSPPGSAPVGGTLTSANSAFSAASAKTVSARSREPKIIADERTNALIIVADDDTTARIRALVAQLDSKVDLSGNKFYVYRCQHAKAEDLADVLAGVDSSSGSGSRSSGSSLSRDDGGSDAFGGGLGGSSAANRSNRTSRSGSSGGLGSGSSRGSSRSSGGGTSSGSRRSSSGGGSFSLGDDISITADPSTNSLIIKASKTDYEKLKELIDKLDVKRRQVLVEAMLLEVAVDQNQALGAEFMVSTGGADGGIVSKSDFGNLSQFFADPTKVSNFAVAAASAGTLKLPGGSLPTQSVLLTALKSNSSVNVLSAPNILTTDNEDAEIVVGQNVPFLASTSSSEENLNNTFNQIDRQDVGITLRITPQISSGDAVTLRIFTEVSSVIAATQNSPLGPTTTVRTSETTVITKDAQMVVIGGLMSDDISENEIGVPFLKDIPVLGQAFRVTSEAHSRKNLLIFITPRIVQDQFDHRDITQERGATMTRDIEENQMFPERQDVLHSPAIDKVAKAKDYEGVKPGTLLPPADDALKDREPAVAEKAAASAENDSRAAFSDVAPVEEPKPASKTMEAPVNVRVVPRLPGAPAPEIAAPDARHGATTATSPERFVVAQIADPNAPLGKLPFKTLGTERTFGLTVPRGIGQSGSFFQVGANYGYRMNETIIPVTVVGVFSSTAEAQGMFDAEPGAWYTLSPYEVMNLGTGPWVSDVRSPETSSGSKE